MTAGRRPDVAGWRWAGGIVLAVTDGRNLDDARIMYLGEEPRDGQQPLTSVSSFDFATLLAAQREAEDWLTFQVASPDPVAAETPHGCYIDGLRPAQMFVVECENGHVRNLAFCTEHGAQLHQQVEDDTAGCSYAGTPGLPVCGAPIVKVT